MLTISKAWMCGGCSDLHCLVGIRASSVIGIPELRMVRWLINHQMMDNNCNFEKCDGTCSPGARAGNPNMVSLYCDTCHNESKVSNVFIHSTVICFPHCIVNKILSQNTFNNSLLRIFQSMETRFLRAKPQSQSHNLY